MQFSRSVEYAVHGLLVMALNEPGAPFLLSDIAQKTKIKESYLRKVFQSLTKAGIVRARRGAGGGYTLAGAAEEITLQHIVIALEGSIPAFNCLKLERACGISEDCPVRRAFNEAQRRMFEALGEMSIRSLAEELGCTAETLPWGKEKKNDTAHELSTQHN